MAIDRPMSSLTWKEIDDLLWKIHRRADKTKDLDTLRDSDRAIPLLKNLSLEIQMEDEKAGQSKSKWPCASSSMRNSVESRAFSLRVGFFFLAPALVSHL